MSRANRAPASVLQLEQNDQRAQTFSREFSFERSGFGANPAKALNIKSDQLDIINLNIRTLVDFARNLATGQTAAPQFG